MTDLTRRWSPDVSESYRYAELLAELLRRSQGQPPRPTLLMALEAWNGSPGFALDLGCGSGRDTLTLLAHGWRVYAIDAEQDAFARLEQSVPTMPPGSRAKPGDRLGSTDSHVARNITRVTIADGGSCPRSRSQPTFSSKIAQECAAML